MTVGSLPVSTVKLASGAYKKRQVLCKVLLNVVRGIRFYQYHEAEASSFATRFTVTRVLLSCFGFVQH